MSKLWQHIRRHLLFKKCAFRKHRFSDYGKRVEFVDNPVKRYYKNYYFGDVFGPYRHLVKKEQKYPGLPDLCRIITKDTICVINVAIRVFLFCHLKYVFISG